MTEGTNRGAAPSTSESGSGRDTPTGSSSRIGSSSESREWSIGLGGNVGTGSLEDGAADADRLRAELCEMARRADVTELELQTLRKQIAKEARRSGSVARQAERLSKERDALEKELGRMKEARTMVYRDGVGPERVIEELRLELCHAREVNASLRLQLSKTQESNEELVLAVKELDEMLRRRGEGGSGEGGVGRDEEEDVYGQMEQLALDFEILRQENHGLSCRLEQSRLQEQLKMHYDCFSCAPAVYELESQIEAMEGELKKRSEELRGVTLEKAKQERRAERAEGQIRKMKLKYASAATKLQEEFTILSEQMALTFEANEATAAKAMTEASRLRSEKCRMEEMLEKANEELSRIRGSYMVKPREDADRIEQMTSETDEKSSSEIKSSERKERAGEIKALESKIGCLEEKISSMTAANDEKDRTIEALRSQLRGVRAKHGETTVSPHEHGPDREQSQKRAAKHKEFTKETNLIPTKKQNDLIAASDRRKPVFHRSNQVAKKEGCAVTSSASDAAERVAESSTSEPGEARLRGTTRESAVLGEKNRSMELELMGLREKYSEMSLRFAEVEGERQRLAMTVQGLARAKNC